MPRKQVSVSAVTLKEGWLAGFSGCLTLSTTWYNIHFTSALTSLGAAGIPPVETDLAGGHVENHSPKGPKSPRDPKGLKGPKGSGFALGPSYNSEC